MACPRKHQQPTARLLCNSCFSLQTKLLLKSLSHIQPVYRARLCVVNIIGRVLQALGLGGGHKKVEGQWAALTRSGPHCWQIQYV
jgi:hypothetical protein